MTNVDIVSSIELGFVARPISHIYTFRKQSRQQCTVYIFCTVVISQCAIIKTLCTIDNPNVNYTNKSMQLAHTVHKVRHRRNIIIRGIVRRTESLVFSSVDFRLCVLTWMLWCYAISSTMICMTLWLVLVTLINIIFCGNVKTLRKGLRSIHNC